MTTIRHEQIQNVSEAGVANNLAKRNVSAQLLASNHVTPITSTTTSWGTLNLTPGSSRQRLFTWTTTHTCVLPDAPSLYQWMEYVITNISTGAITVNIYWGTFLTTVAEWKAKLFINIVNTNNVSSWKVVDYDPVIWGGWLKLPTYTVWASWADYTTIQWAIDAATSWGTIYVIDGTYTLTSQLLFKYANTRIIGNGFSTKIQGDCATVTTLIGFNASNLSGCSLENFYIANTNWTTQGIGLNFSNTPLCNFKNLHFYNLGTAIRANDTANYTFYNRFEDIKIFECNNGMDFTSTNPFNDNEFSNVRVALKAWGTGKWLYMNNAQGNTFHNCNFEPSSGNTGIHLDSVNVINTTFYDIYVEGNTTGINIASAQRTTFIGGMIVANTTNVTDTGLDTAYLNTNVNYALYNQLANVVARDLSNASRKAIDVYNNTSFAHTGGSLARIAMQNATDTSDVVLIENAWNGAMVNLTSTKGTLQASPIKGDIETDTTGKLYYTHNNNERWVVDAEQYISLTSTYTLTSQTAAQKLFNTSTNWALTVKGATTYMFECLYSLSAMSATSGSFGFAIGGTATLTSIAWESYAVKWVLTAVAWQSTFNSTASNVTLATAGTATTGYAKIKWIIRVNASWTIIPQVSLGVAAAAVVGVNSYFRIWAVGTNTDTKVGNWS